MGKNELLEMLEELNSLGINELDERIANMQITYEKWDKLMGWQGFWWTGPSDTPVGDLESLQGKKAITYQDYKRLAKKYRQKVMQLKEPTDPQEKQIKEKSELLADKVETEEKISECSLGIEYYKAIIEEEELDKEEYNDYQEKLKALEIRIKRCESFQEERKKEITQRKKAETTELTPAQAEEKKKKENFETQDEHLTQVERAKSFEKSLKSKADGRKIDIDSFKQSLTKSRVTKSEIKGEADELYERRRYIELKIKNPSSLTSDEKDELDKIKSKYFNNNFKSINNNAKGQSR